MPPRFCPSGISYLPPRLLSPLRILPSPSAIDRRPVAVLRRITLLWMVQRMPGGVPNSVRISFQFGGSSDPSASAKRLVRHLSHR